MAVENLRLPNSPDVNRSWRRISNGKLSFLYREEKIIPNYLKSPAASCHDVCKYGRKYESEDKPRFSPLKRVTRSFSGTLNLDSPLRKKKALTKSALNPTFGSGDGSDHDKSEVRNFSSGVCDAKKKKEVPLSEFRLDDSTKRKKKTVSQPRGRVLSRSKEMVELEHNKRVIALKLKSVAHTVAMALQRSTVNRKQINGGSKVAEPKKAVVVHFRTSMPPKRYSRSLKTKKESNSLSAPLRKTRKRVDKDLVEEKTLYVVKMKTGDEIVGSDQNQRCVMNSLTEEDPKSEKSQDEAQCSVTEADDESSQEEKEDDGNVSLSEDKNRTRKGKSKAQESAVNGKSMKLRFKRGKIVDVVGSQDNSPRKLKFKRGKTVTGADTTSKSGGRRSLKNKGTNFSNEKEQQHKPRSLKVALKHQDAQKKRDSRVLLFNNVIEETANKLVKTRKSKVKALVGAFESVISLQESNASATT